MQERKNQTRSVREETAREQKFWKRNQLWTLLLLAAVLLFSFLKGSGLSMYPGPEALVLTMYDGKTTTIAYDQITSAQLLEQPDYGKAVDGAQGRDGKSGIWTSDAWGEYTLCVYASCDQAIQIQCHGYSYVVNLSSEWETRQLYETLLDKIPVSQ